MNVMERGTGRAPTVIQSHAPPDNMPHRGLAHAHFYG